MLDKKRPGRAGTRTRPKQAASTYLNLTRIESLLAVEPPNAAEREFAAKVMQQLPGLPEPRIMVLLNIPKHPVVDDAQRVANEHREPVAIVNMDGKLLAYRMPE